MIKMIGATICGVALTVSAADIAFNSPVSWGTIRSNDVTASFIVDSSLIGSPITLTLSKSVNGKKSEVSSKKMVLKSVNSEYLFPVSKPVPGGIDYHSLTWEVNGQNGVISPFGIAPVSNSIDPKALPVVQTSEEVTAESSTVEGISSISIDNNSVAFAWNSKSLSLIVTGTGKVTVVLDPSNSKGSLIITSILSESNVSILLLLLKLKNTSITASNTDMSNTIFFIIFPSIFY